MISPSITRRNFLLCSEIDVFERGQPTIRRIAAEMWKLRNCGSRRPNGLNKPMKRGIERKRPIKKFVLKQSSGERISLSVRPKMLLKNLLDALPLSFFGRTCVDGADCVSTGLILDVSEVSLVVDFLFQKNRTTNGRSMNTPITRGKTCSKKFSSIFFGTDYGSFTSGRKFKLKTRHIPAV